MYGQPPRFTFSGNGQPPPNYVYSNNNYYYPSLFPFVNLNVPIPNPSFDFNSQLSNKTVMEHNKTMKKIGKAVTKARKNLVDAGEHVSVVKVVQNVILGLKVDSWDSLGVKMQNVRVLHRLMLLERKINTFINCFVEVWEIITIFDLETAICKNEGVEVFEELELGPLIRHPLVNSYFCVSSDSTAVFKISGEEIVNFLVKFMDTHIGKEVEADELLDFIAKKRSVDSKEKLHVRIQSLGLHLSFIKQARPLEISILKNCLLSNKKDAKGSSGVTSECIKSFYSGYGDDITTNDNNGDTCLTSIHSSQNMKSSGRVSSCPFPSENEEKIRLGMLSEKEKSPLFDRLNCNQSIKKAIEKRKSDSSRSLDRLSCNESIKKTTKKRKSDAIDCTSYASCTLPIRDGAGQGSEGKGKPSTKGDVKKKKCEVVNAFGRRKDFKQQLSTCNNEDESAKIIAYIRSDEFGLVSDFSTKLDRIMKQHHFCKESCSQDSHFLLELVRNADDNVYPCDVEPTLAFILQEEGVIVLNNDQGFSVENIKSFCHVRDSTKKELNAGFESLFWVTDAPEIHSNRFHIRFDISDSQIGFVLPTIVPPCDVSLFSKLVSVDNNAMDKKCWDTCIVLPFRSKKTKAFVVENLISMFSKFHPSLLLFLHRLECIKFKDLLNDSLIVIRKEIVGDGIVNVSLGKEKMTWFVKSHKLHADDIHFDVQKTEISMALMLEDSNNGYFIPKLEHQAVFAFLPVRKYGLKFIIQADFVLPLSREEVDVGSSWNQWLLSEFPNLFVIAEISFCSLPCFKKNPAKGVSVFMSFVPLEGEVHGFFSCLPRMIISKLCSSNCLLLEGDGNEWVPPCKVLRNWTEETRSLFPESLIREHLGVGYLNKDTVLTDSLALALGIEECGPKVIIQVLTSLCLSGSLKSMSLSWLSSCLNVLFLMLVNETEYDFISSLSQLPIIPLLNGNYASINEGAIWLHTDLEHGLEAFGKLYLELRVVDPAIFNDHVENITRMLYKVGVQQLSTHEVLKGHILPAICDEKVMSESTELMIEYLSFIMFHLELSCCSECLVEKEHILSQLRNSAYILTNHGYKRLVDVPIHFSKEFGNPIDMSKLVGGTDMKWFEIDILYMKHPVCKSSPEGALKWRNFLQKLGVTDFVQIVEVKKGVDWDSQELLHLMSHVSSNSDKDKSKYLLKVLNKLWDGYFSDKPFKPYVIKILHAVPWLVSNIDDQLHYPKDLFHRCKTVREVLGDRAPYAVPKVKNVNFLNDICLKNTITLDDVLSLLYVWRRSKKSFRASITQMSKFYTYIWNEMGISKQKIFENLHSQAFIFVPHSFGSTKEVVSGLFLSPSEVYWHDSITSSMEQTKSTHPQFYQYMTNRLFSKMLSNVYPGLHDFFVNDFGVADNPPLLSYLQSLIQLSTGSLPSQAAKTVFQVFQKWSDGLNSGVLSSGDIIYLKRRIEEKEMKILPTMQDKWVSLHHSFGIICWCDDEQLGNEFKNLNNVEFLCFGELTTREKQMLQDNVSVLFRKLGIPSLSEVVTREAIYDGLMDSSFKASLVNWVLPYAQRYIYTIHPNVYIEFKSSGFKNLSCLRIVVVQKLVYMNVIKKYGIQSNKRFKCSCLVQDNILYATYKSDTHSLFMELSRFLLPGFPELPLANFLNTITTMAELGSIEEQMEFFITDNQKLLNLPCEESQWSLTFSTSQTRQDVTERLINRDGDWIIPASTIPSVILEEDEALKEVSDSVIRMNGGFKGQLLDCGKNIVPIAPKHVITGRTGEVVAFKYFSAKLGEKFVKWVNEFNESGLPYDIVIEGEDNSKEYIEVKATSHAWKDWFGISIREWQFAVKKGDSFSIAHVVISNGKSAQITTYRNPAKLCQLKHLHLQLALQPPKQ